MTNCKLKPDLQQSRAVASTAHSVVIKLKEMGLPEDLDDDLGTLSTDLGDLWSAQKELVDLLEGLTGTVTDWGNIGDSLVDLRSAVDHIRWHADSVRRPMNKITQYAYRRAGQY